MRKLLVLALINLTIFFGLLVLLEFSARIFVDSYSNHKDFRLSQPAPYIDAPYFSREFIEESFKQPGGWTTQPGSNLIYPNDFKGKYFTVENGIRHTTDSPPKTEKSIFLFGGSTVYNSEVPDEHTIASYLQRKLLANGYTDYRVVNLGVTSISTNQQLDRLKATTIAEGDVVIFFDGVNDVIQGVLYGNAGNTIHGSDKSRPTWQKLLSKSSDHSVLLRTFLSHMNANYKISNKHERIEKTVSLYRNNIESAHAISQSRGAGFLHFLQPTLYSHTPHSEYEEKLLTLGLLPAQAEDAFVSTYPYFLQFVLERTEKGYAAYDLTTIFNATNKAIYLDFCHVNHIGNEIIANHIYSGLIDSALVN